MTPDEMAQQMQQSMEQQSGNSVKLKVVETRNVTIDGKQTSLTVSEGSNSSGMPIRQWMTAFKEKSGIVLVMIRGAISEWDDATWNSFLASITS
jgi:leucyl aminopeptidase